MNGKTFNQWSKLGFKIIKGSKSKSRNSEGVPLFTKDQVELSIFNYDDEYERELDQHFMGDYFG